MSTTAQDHESANGSGSPRRRARSTLPQAIILTPSDAAVAIARSLASRGVAVSMLAQARGRGWRGGWTNWPHTTRAAKGYSLGDLPESRDEWIACLSELGRHDGVLISCSDRGSELLIDDRGRIPERLRSFEGPGSAHRELMDKGKSYALAERAGVRTPWTLHLSSVADLERVSEQASYPCVIKPALAHLWRRLFGERRVLLVEGPGDLAPLARPGLDAGLELLVNEYVPGPDTNLETVNFLRDPDGSFPLAYAHRFVRQYPPGFGAASVTELADAPGALALGRALLDAAGFVGLASVQTKRHAETGESVLIEVNVRVPMNFGLGDAAGADASWRVYAKLAGIPLPPAPTPARGVRSITPSIEPRAARAYVSEGKLRPHEILASYRGVRGLNGLSWRDPKPALVLGAVHLGEVASRVRRTRESTTGARDKASSNGSRPRKPRDRSRFPQAILLTPNDAAVALARKLASRGVAVSMLDEGRGKRGGWASWPRATSAAGGCSLGDLPDSRDEWLARLETLGRRDGVLISCSDRSTEFLVNERDRIPVRLRSFESADSAHLELMDKGSLYALAERAGVRTPWALRLSSAADLERVSAQASYPCVLKPALSHLWRRLFGDRRVFVVDGPDRLAEIARPGVDAGLELLVTEYVPGPDSNLETANLLRDPNGHFPLAYGQRFLRQYPPGFGAASVTESTEAPGAMALGRALLDAAGFVGLASVLSKRHAETGESVLIESNVRVPMTFGLAEASGADASWRLYATLAGIPLPPPPTPASGVRSVTPSLEPRAVAAHVAEGILRPRQVLAAYRGVRDLNGLSWRDPKPALALGARLVHGIASRGIRRAAGSRRPAVDHRPHPPHGASIAQTDARPRGRASALIR